MKSDGFLKHLAVASTVTLLIYAALYATIEYRRTRNGPWIVSFTNAASGAPALRIDEPKLGITNFAITFTGQTNAGSNAVITFSKPVQTPYDVPFGQCIFMDTTFLPGTIVLSLFNHEIQLIPRTLTVDRIEIPWQSNTNVLLAPANPIQTK